MRIELQGTRIKGRCRCCAAAIKNGAAKSHKTRCTLRLAPCTSKGFTLIELIIVIIIVVILMALFLNRVLFYQEQAEKTAMEQVAGAIQSALTMQYGQMLTRGKPSDLAALARENPVNWLQKLPSNYAGEFYDPTPLSVAPGRWVFDLQSRHLIYVLRSASYFEPGKDGKKWIRFHVITTHEPPRLPSLQDTPAELSGILFTPVEPYSWLRITSTGSRFSLFGG